MGIARRCPLCGGAVTNAERKDSYWFIPCEVCGWYRVDEVTASDLAAGRYEEEQPLLRMLTRKASTISHKSGDPKWVFLTRESIRTLTSGWPLPLPPRVKMDLFLEYLAEKQKSAADAISLKPECDYPLAACCDRSELDFIEKALREQGLMEAPNDQSVRLTAAGWDRIEERKDPEANTAGEAQPSEPELDHLTRVRVRRLLDEELPVKLAEAARERCPLGVIMVDIDHFKQINDRHGHQKGDAVLRGVAAKLAHVVIGRGWVYRYGGEEFTFILQNSTLHEAIAAAERARRSLEDAATEGVPVTASFGVAIYPEHGEDASQLIEVADQALRDAKGRGRNVVRVPGDAEAVLESWEPVRRQPEVGVLTEVERERIRRDYFAVGIARCPRDEALLQVKEWDHTGGSVQRLLVRCKSCGLFGEV